VLAAVNLNPNVGCAQFSVTVPAHTVNNATNSYFLEFSNSVFDGTVNIQTARVYYKLQVSPPPGTATFADVPTTHLFFQYIEALAVAGTTSGCGGGNFCPDAAVTRGQMAVFLAKALGLHWTL
jgi:S-layer family protein